MIAICRHDFQRFFRSPLGYVYLGVFAVIANLVYFAYCVLSSSSDLSSPFSFLLTVLLFMTPILTMRLLSEEYRQGTDRLLLTAPVRIGEIVLGKFFAALGVIACCLIAAVLSFAVFLGLYLVDALSAAASGTLASILSWFSIFTRYDTFMSAQFSFSNVVYFLSLTVLFLFFTARVLERRRQ